jgi:hypothetical protein
MMKQTFENSTQLLLFLKNISSINLTHDQYCIENGSPSSSISRKVNSEFKSENLSVDVVHVHSQVTSKSSPYLVFAPIVKYSLKNELAQYIQDEAFTKSCRLAVPLQNETFIGKLFSFLPLPIETGLPVHIQASFAMASNRRSLWIGSDTKGNGKPAVAWNDYLFQTVIPHTYARLMEYVGTNATHVSLINSLFPDLKHPKLLPHSKETCLSLMKILIARESKVLFGMKLLAPLTKL